jgi:hypothetical protein
VHAQHMPLGTSNCTEFSSAVSAGAKIPIVPVEKSPTPNRG